MERYEEALKKLEGFTEKDIRIIKSRRRVMILSMIPTGGGIYTKESEGKTLIDAIEKL